MQSVSQQENAVKGREGAPSTNPSPNDHFFGLSWEDRRILLGANLRLLSYRLRRGFPVLKGDISRMVVLADDADRDAGVAA